MKKISLIFFLAHFIIISQVISQELTPDWPREIEAPKAKVVIYQPQLENFTYNKLQARAAVSVTKEGEKDPKFGAIWVLARVSTDKNTRMVELLDVKITAVKFPNATKSDESRLSQFLEKEIPKWNLQLSLDRLISSLELADKKVSAETKLKNTPPRIIFVTYPAVLVLIDGEPKLKKIENSSLKYIINTPYFIVLDTTKKTYYLKGSAFWFSASELKGPWIETKSPPAKAVEISRKMEKKQKEQQKQPSENQEVDKSIVPKIFVSTKPAELIQSDGEPKYIPIKGTNLLYMNNTESDVIMDISSQKYFILISGRWYTSGSLTGKNWNFVESKKLPKDFAKIPPESDMGAVLSSVAGTKQAKEAVLENSIPQTSKVDRKKAKLTVKYDGKPKFKKIEGTKISYAVNTDKSVLKFKGKYYCCDEAIWFEAKKSEGPWKVCVSVPKEFQTIPPSSPVYNVKYVYVYDHTPDVVYVGYTPGYYGSYVYGGCVVYGTGWYYYPWYGTYYYPRPVTWGFGVHWNPYTGWGFSFGISYGWFRIGWGVPYSGWWGASGYHHGYRHGFYHGYHAGRRTGFRAGYRAANYQNNMRRNINVNRNIYNRGRTGVYSRNINLNQTLTGKRTPATIKRPNNIYTGRNGDIYRKTGNQWHKKSKKGWKSSGSSSRLNSWQSTRKRGTSRTNSFRKMSGRSGESRRRR